jgi:hypothetical protein
MTRAQRWDAFVSYKQDDPGFPPEKDPAAKIELATLFNDLGLKVWQDGGIESGR